jgi:hypothetical protein
VKTSSTCASGSRFGRSVATLVVLAAVVFGGAFPAAAQLIDTDTIEDPFIQLNDVVRPDKDSWAIRGQVNVNTGSNPVAAGLADGAIALVYQAGSALGAFVLVESQTWDASDCKSLSGGRSLVCRNDAGASIRLRGTQSSPWRYRVYVSVRRQELSPGKPFELPLSAEIQIGPFDWTGSGDVNYCTVSLNGDRTTCRSKQGGPG